MCRYGRPVIDVCEDVTVRLVHVTESVDSESGRHVANSVELRLDGFLADWRSEETVVGISVEPDVQYVEEGRSGLHCNFDFALSGLTVRTLELVFIKAAVYDVDDRLVTYRYLNRNAVGPSGIETVVSTRIDRRETVGLFNPFHSFPTDLPLHHLRFMFTFHDMDTGEQFHYGDVAVRPVVYDQLVELDLPVRGLVTILDGHDYYSHHRRFDMNIARPATGGAMQSNFARYALDFVHIGGDGNTRSVPFEERRANYDFRFPDARRFYSHGEPVYAPGSGEVVAAVRDRPDLYDDPFDLDEAVNNSNVHDLAGNHVVIRHNDHEYSHLFHFLKDSLEVEIGQRVDSGDMLGRIGFSGAATVYTHLHYQLMDGPDFLIANPLPARFRRAVFVQGDQLVELTNTPLDTADTIWNP
jgi:murein DD-endopeptidase MepM/ murein hydrolase activator NlpD